MTRLNNVNDTTTISRFDPSVQNLFNHYYVQEPTHKRPHDLQIDMEYAPKAKRRMDKMSDCLEQFSINKENQFSSMLESSDDDMSDGDQPEAQCSEPLVEEPEEHEVRSFKIDDNLKAYLQSTRYNERLLPKNGEIKGDELILWSPHSIMNPLDDARMIGRIHELTEAEEEETNEEVLENEGMLSEDIYQNQYAVIDSEPASVISSRSMSADTSPIHSPPLSNVEITEVTEDDARTHSDYTSDVDMMECD